MVVDRVVEAIRHMAVSELPPPPYRDQCAIGDQVILRVMFEDGTRLVGTVVDSVTKLIGSNYVVMVKVKIVDGEPGSTALDVRAEWLD